MRKFGEKQMHQGSKTGHKTTKSFLDSVARGISDADTGRTYNTEEIRAALAARRSTLIDQDVWRTHEIP